ncbi:MAG: hypothetical protein ACI4XA_01910 [Oscillospiraceae bacterium]
MNKKDFYKQLMSEYSFDAEEIRKNAKKGRTAGHKISPMYIGITAAAAVVTVAAGTAVFSLAGRNDGVSLVAGNTLAALSDTQRLEKAMEEIRRSEGSSELTDVFITFTEPFSPSTVQEILTSHSEGSVNVKMLYFADGTRAVGEEQVRSGFAGTNKISGAVINCAGSLMVSLNNDSNIFAVEKVTDSDDISVVSPINVNTETTEPVCTDTPVNTDSGNNNSILPPDEDTSAATEETMDGEAIDTSEGSSDGTAEPDDTFETFETESVVISGEDTFETTFPDSTEETAEPTVPVTPDNNTPTDNGGNVQDNTTEPAEKLPAGVTLPTAADKFSIDTYIEADTAFFVTEETFFVKTPDAIALYRMNNSEPLLVAEAECSDAKICYISEKGSEMLITGVVDGKRRKLFLADAGSESITDLCAEDFVMDGTLAGVGYNDSTGTVYLNVKENGVYYVNSAELIGSRLEFIGMCFESEAKTTLLASGENSVYLAAADGSLTQIFKISSDGSRKQLISAFDNNPKFTANLAFTHAVMTPSDSSAASFTEIFDPTTESFIRLDTPASSVSFGASRHSFSADGSLYTVSGGKAEPAAGIAVIKDIEYRRSLSSQYTTTIAYGCVKLTPAVFTKELLSGNVAFGDITDSAPSDIRAAFNGALGVNNLLAQNKAASSGITTQDMLIKCISVYYSDSAEAALRKKCGISEYGALSYNNGGLTAISVSDTALVISSKTENTARGTLYVKAGTFCGKTAYLARSVDLVKENGSWKLNMVL